MIFAKTDKVNYFIIYYNCDFSTEDTSANENSTIAWFIRKVTKWSK